VGRERHIAGFNKFQQKMKKKEVIQSTFDKLLHELNNIEGKGLIVPLSLFFMLSFAYFLICGEGLFFFQENNALFIFSKDYFQKFTDRPGGLLIYARNFLTQFYFNPFAASSIISLLLIFVCVILQKIIRFMAGSRPYSLVFILLPSFLLLLLQTRSDFYLHEIMGYLMVLIWFLATIRNSKTYVRYIIVAFFPLFYYVVGSFAIIYAGMYIVFHIRYEKGSLRFILPGLLLITAYLSFFIFKNQVFFQPVDHLLSYPLFFNNTPELLKYLSYLGIFFILLPLLVNIPDLNKRIKGSEQALTFFTILLLFLSVIFSLVFSYDAANARVMQVEKMAYNQDWNGIIRENEKSPSDNIVGQYYYNLALSETGQLCSRLFFSPQNFGSMSLTLQRDDEQSDRAMYFYYYIGLSSEAHHLAYELMVQHGFRPETIKMLIKTELIKGNLKIAERYINILKKTFHYRQWVKRYERMLINPEMINTDPDLGEKIRLQPKGDFFIFTDDKSNLEYLRKVSPDNVKAFEYKMARLLLEKDLMELGKEVKYLKGLGYTQIPRHIDEGIVALVNVTGEFPDMGGMKINSDTDQRFIKYFSDIKAFKGNKALMEKEIKKTEKNTFWYYLHFGLIKRSILKSGSVDNTIY
jgi:hypothetical protein